MTLATQTILKDVSLNAEKRCPKEDLVVDVVSLQTDVKDSSDLCLLELLRGGCFLYGCYFNLQLIHYGF